MSTFSKCLGILGLSNSEAAKYLDLSESDIERFCMSSGQVEEGIWFKLADLYGDVLIGSNVAEGEFQHHGIPEEAFENLDMGTAGMPKGAGEAAGALAVLNELLLIRTDAKRERP